jgi:hypothetical protein
VARKKPSKAKFMVETTSNKAEVDTLQLCYMFRPHDFINVIFTANVGEQCNKGGLTSAPTRQTRRDFWYVVVFKHQGDGG